MRPFFVAYVQTLRRFAQVAGDVPLSALVCLLTWSQRLNAETVIAVQHPASVVAVLWMLLWLRHSIGW